MRDFSVACFGEHAVRVAETSCTSGGGVNGSSIISSNAVENSVTCYYRITLSSRKELLIKMIWTKRNSDVLGSIVVADNPSMLKPNGTNCQLLKRKKGSGSFVTCNTVFNLHYDLSAVKYVSGPEPIKDFFVILIADAEFCLLLGDRCSEFVMKYERSIPTTKVHMFSRKEQVVNTTLYSTKAQFREGGIEHEVMIRCKGDAWDSKDSEVYISVDKKRFISVKRLQWNFRGNQAIHVEEGFTIDVMWDVHDWWFCDASRSAFFVFRTRTILESRLWSDEELGQAVSGFSLLIQLYKS